MKPGLSGATSPSCVRVPSGKISTSSPAFRRRSVSLRPARPPPSRSMGIASKKLNELLEARHAEERVAGEVVHPPRAGQAHERRIEMALMIRSRPARRLRRPVFAPRTRRPNSHTADQPGQDAQRVVAETLGERRDGAEPGAGSGSRVQGSKVVKVARDSPTVLLANLTLFLDSRRTISSNRSTTCSGVRPSVTTSTASAALSSAPTGRAASRAVAVLTAGRELRRSVAVSPRAMSSSKRRRARSGGLAVRKILHSACGKGDRALIAAFGDDVAAPRRSAAATRPAAGGRRRCRRPDRRRRKLRSCGSRPRRPRHRAASARRRMSIASDSASWAIAVGVACAQARAATPPARRPGTSRRYRETANPSRSARRRAMVLLPAPAGPSMATIMSGSASRHVKDNRNQLCEYDKVVIGGEDGSASASSYRADRENPYSNLECLGGGSD